MRPEVTTITVEQLYEKDKGTIIAAADEYRGTITSDDPIKITFKSDIDADDYFKNVGRKLIYSAMRLDYK